MQVWRFSERTQVRMAARAGALLTLSLLCWCALQVGRPRFALIDAPPGAAISISVLSRDEPPQTAQRPPPDQVSQSAQTIASVAPAAGSEGERVRLWDETADGRVLFRSLDQYWRCSEARQARTDLADCPSREDQRAFGFVGDTEASDGLGLDTADQWQRRRPRRQ